MSYLDIVNNILKRLRERTVATVNESSYSSLIAVLVNDAKETVENAFQWSGLRTTLTATTTSDVFNYELNGSLNAVTVLDVINVTDNFFLKPKGSHESLLVLRKSYLTLITSSTVTAFKEPFSS